MTTLNTLCKGFTKWFAVLLLLHLAACGGGSTPSGSSLGNDSPPTTNGSNTGSGNTGSTSGNTGNTGSTTGNTGNTGSNTGNTGSNTGNTGSNTGNTGSNTGNTGGSGTGTGEPTVLEGSTFTIPVIAGAPAPVVVVPSNPTAFQDAFYLGSSTGNKAVVPAADRPFSSALKLTGNIVATNSYDIGVKAPTIAPVKKGDVLWVYFQVRRITSLKETGEMVADITFIQKDVNNVEVRPLENRVAANLDWKVVSIPFVATENSATGAASINIRFGMAAQSFEVGGFTVLNYGSTVKVSNLPRSVGSYEGSAPNAAWRVKAAERIEQIRKGDLPIRVVDGQGNPVADADIAVRMKRHAFGWGAMVDARDLAVVSRPDTAKVREVVGKYFNKVVFGNDMKWYQWKYGNQYDQFSKFHALNAMTWLETKNIPVRGHVMVWPSWKYLPDYLDDYRTNPAYLRNEVLAHIDDQTSTVNNRVAEWDVVNETYAHNDALFVMGGGNLTGARNLMVDWFKRARAGAPNTKLFYNDYTMFSGTSSTSASQHLYDTVKFLKDAGAPIDAIGEQAHFGTTPPGPPAILAALDRFSALGLPIQWTEFDIDTEDVEMQTNFMRDATTAAFSHPSMTGITHWGIWEGYRADYYPNAAMWNKDWTLRPHGQAWVDLVTKTWWTNADGKSNSSGNFQTRGFYGDYEITVTKGNKTRTVNIKLETGGALKTITLN
jgi:endo-1,4-beta-xylanase